MTERGTRLLATWIPSDKDVEYAQSLGMSASQIALEAEKFRDYWVALPGQRATKLDWPATWRNWVRRDYAREMAAIKEMRRIKQSMAVGQLEIIAAHVKRPWCERGRYARDVLEQCVEAELLTREEMEAVL